MKKIKIVLLVMFTVLFQLSCQYKKESEQIELEFNGTDIVEDFYKLYIKSSFLDNRDTIFSDSVLMDYCINGLFENLNNVQLDFDPFLASNDISLKWADNLNIKLDTVLNLYHISFRYDFFDGDTEEANIWVSLIKVDSNYKIQSIYHRWNDFNTSLEINSDSLKDTAWDLTSR